MGIATLIKADLVETRQPEKEVIISARQQGRLNRQIHQTLSAIDSSLDTVVDRQYRETLVKTAYALRILEESIHMRSYC